MRCSTRGGPALGRPLIAAVTADHSPALHAPPALNMRAKLILQELQAGSSEQKYLCVGQECN